MLLRKTFLLVPSCLRMCGGTFNQGAHVNWFCTKTETNPLPNATPSNNKEDDIHANNSKPFHMKPKEKLAVFTDYYGQELWTLPNIITYSRMVASPFLGLAIVYDYKSVALAGCAVAGFSDWLDGYIAKNYNQMTVLGGMIDPAADKIMIGCLTAGIAWKGLLPVELCALILGRDVLLLGGSFILRGMERPKGTPFFDTTYSATFEIIPSNLSKLNTIMQFGLLASTLLHWGIEGGLPPVMGIDIAQGLVPLQYITAATTLGSLVGYLDGSAIKRLSPSGERRGRGEYENEETETETETETDTEKRVEDSKATGKEVSSK